MNNEEIKEENTTEVESINSTQIQEENETIKLNDFEINMAINMNYIVKVGETMVENLICNFNGNNIVYQQNVMNDNAFVSNLEYCQAVEQKFKEKINVMAEKLNYVQRLV